MPSVGGQGTARSTKARGTSTFYNRSEEHTSELQSHCNLVCRLLLEKQKNTDGSRLFLPPYLDPIEPNVDPLLVDGVNPLGPAMAWALAGQSKTGIVINAVFDRWTTP